MFSLILCVSNVTKYSYNDTGSVILYTNNEWGVVSVVWGHIVSSHGEDTAKNEVSPGILLLLSVL